MVEVVAKAICESRLWEGAWATMKSRHERRVWITDARAAILAMRKASQEMSWAGAKHLNGSNVGGRAYRVWEAMIDEALK